MNLQFQIIIVAEENEDNEKEMKIYIEYKKLGHFWHFRGVQNKNLKILNFNMGLLRKWV